MKKKLNTKINSQKSKIGMKIYYPANEIKLSFWLTLEIQWDLVVFENLIYCLRARLCNKRFKCFGVDCVA